MFRHNDIPANPIQDTNLELRFEEDEKLTAIF